jgi:hypothetical protein
VNTGVRSGTGLIDYWIEDCIVQLYGLTSKTEQIPARLLAEMNVMQKGMGAKMDTNEEEIKKSQAKMDAKLN